MRERIILQIILAVSGGVQSTVETAESDQLYVPAILNADFQFPDGDRPSLELEHIPQLISSENNMHLSWQEFDLGNLKASISSS